MRASGTTIAASLPAAAMADLQSSCVRCMPCGPVRQRQPADRALSLFDAVRQQ